jgi:hypothetical protein
MHVYVPDTDDINIRQKELYNYTCIFSNWTIKLAKKNVKVFGPLLKFQGEHWFTSCTWLSKYHIFMITELNCIDNKQSSYKIMKIQGQARHREYMPRKLSGGQAYDVSSD